jgi:hypothetical protein
VARFAILLVLLVLPAFPQGRGGGRGGRGGPPPTPQASAPIDLTGSWVSVVTEDWMFRMVTPPKGSFLGVPINGAARTLANAWDPAADEAAGNACKAYGAAALMRRPGRLRITWENPTTIKMETEAGVQTRLLNFGGTAPASGDLTWQGYTAAEWEMATVGRGAPPRGNLKAVTTRMRAGYLRKNGVPYSEDAVLTEYWDVYTADNGDVWLVVTTAVHDPRYLTTDFITSSHFKKLPATDTTWRPEPCSAR